MAQDTRNNMEGCYPFERMKEVHDQVREEQPKTDDYTTTEKLMSPGPDEELEN
jgi:hypothetical protein